MVYESDFYTSRRPYSSRITPTISSYSVTPLAHYERVPSQLTKYLPGVGKVYVVNTYARHIPYGGHQRLTTPIRVIRVRPSVIQRELDRIEHKMRPNLTYTNPYIHYLSTSAASAFDDETRNIRSHANALLKLVHEPTPRVTVRYVVPHTYINRYTSLPIPAKCSPEMFMHRMMMPVTKVADNILSLSYYSDPVKRFIGPGHLACVRYAGDKVYPKRRYISDLTPLTEQVIRNDIHLLSYYLKNRQAAAAGAIPKSITAPLPALRASRHFTEHKMLPDPEDEKKELAQMKAAQRTILPTVQSDPKYVIKKTKQQEAKEAEEERALAEERARQKEAKKREEEAKRMEAQRQAELEKQRLLEEEAEREAQRIEKARKEEESRQAAEKARQEEEKRLAEEKRLEEERLAKEAILEAERKAEEARLEAERIAAEEARLEAERKAEEARLEEEKKAEEARLEEERRQAEVAHLEEMARQLEDEKEAELARQAEELAELARQESELAKKAQEGEKESEAEPELSAETAAEPETPQEVTEVPSATTDEETVAEEQPIEPVVATEEQSEPIVEEPVEETSEVPEATPAEEVE